MLITVKDGRAIDVRGNPEHPFTRGGLCVKVNNYTDRVYSPERVLYPLKRSGPKGSGQFTRLSCVTPRLGGVSGWRTRRSATHLYPA